MRGDTSAERGLDLVLLRLSERLLSNAWLDITAGAGPCSLPICSVKGPRMVGVGHRSMRMRLGRGRP